MYYVSDRSSILNEGFMIDYYLIISENSHKNQFKENQSFMIIRLTICLKQVAIPSG